MGVVMSMNREQKRQMQKMGQINENGAPVRTPRTAPPPKTQDDRTSPRQFLREVKGELRKVVWPTREETRNYSILVLITVVFFTALVATLDWAFGLSVLWVYDR
jgi:preprotein translocase subunit SecE